MVEVFAHEDYNPESTTVEKDRVEFSDRYYEVKSFLVDKAKEFQGEQALEQSVRASDASMHGGVDRVRLPQIQLQTFNGDIDEWLSFRDLFTSLIHCKANLPEVEKFHYLKGCLQGEPRSLIDPLQTTKANYQVAWDLLLRRYNNSKQLKKRQVLSLFKLPTLAKESGAELHTLVEGFERIVQTLDQIVQPVDYRDLLLVNILTERLDPITRRGWEELSATKEQDLLADLSEFLHRRIQVLDCMPSKSVDTRGVQQIRLPQKLKSASVRTSYSTFQASGGRCVACSSNHPLYQCNEFQRMEVFDRDALLKTHSLCRNCFRSGHLARECQSKYSCRNCRSRHHTLVCFKPERERDGRISPVAGSNSPSRSNDATNSNSTQVANLAATNAFVSGAVNQHASQVILATAVVVIEDDDGCQYRARALLDSGSESNFVTERLSRRMKVSRDRVDISVLGIGQAATQAPHRIHATVRSRVSEFYRELDFLILPTMTVNLPTTRVKTDDWSVPGGIRLADPAFFEPNEVDLVLGIESFFDFFETGRRMSLGEGNPTLSESVFGWVISGGVTVPRRSLQVTCNLSTLEDRYARTLRFWSCEKVESGKAHSTEETRCEDHFVRTVRQGADGWYRVGRGQLIQGQVDTMKLVHIHVSALECVLNRR